MKWWHWCSAAWLWDGVVVDDPRSVLKARQSKEPIYPTVQTKHRAQAMCIVNDVIGIKEQNSTPELSF